MLRVGADRAASASKRCAPFQQLLLHPATVLLKAFVVGIMVIACGMEKIKSLEDIVRQGMTSRRFAQWLSRPALALL
jgi:ABC-type uncharacterized transport system permease subunit